MTPIREFFIDLDDVLNTFTIDALRHLGCKIDHYQEYPARCGYNLAAAANNLLGRKQFTPETIWQCFDASFWANCRPSEECHWLIEEARRRVGEKNVYILTSSNPRQCVPGKYEWAARHLPLWIQDQIIPTSAKRACAKAGAVLIDDYTPNCDAFHRAGGQAWIVPRPWNSLGNVPVRAAMSFDLVAPQPRLPSLEFLRAIGLVPSARLVPSVSA